MARWKSRAGQAVLGLERNFDRGQAKLRKLIGSLDPPAIASYNGYGRADRLHLEGRVLDENNVRSPRERERVWANMRMMYRRFASAEIPGAVVEARYGTTVATAVTNEEGFYSFDLAPEAPITGSDLWHAVSLRLLEPTLAGETVETTGRVLVPGAGARFGVITDLDDTVMRTDVASYLRMARTVYLGNARTRMPFPGVAAFYRALHMGVSGVEFNPIFYVSSSPWNIYDVIHEFLELQQIPHGPLFLRDWGISDREILPTSHRTHKLDAIRRILEFYPALPFLLIGDSGQEDPEIYLDVVRQYGERIHAVYIRRVRSRRPNRPEAIAELFRASERKDVSLKLVGDTLAAAQDAAGHGWIASAVLEEIAGTAAKDRTPQMPAPE